VGNYTFKLIVKDELAPFSIQGSVTFEVEITNIPNEYNHTVNMTQNSVIPLSKPKIDRPKT